MGILNLTPDSFSDGGRFHVDGRLDIGRVEAAAIAMVAAGATLLDLGGESTRPGAAPVPEQEELDRVLPVLQRLRGIDAVLSVDTRKAVVARQSLASGAQLVNDVTGFSEPDMRAAVANSNAALCIMHMRGEPRSMQVAPEYEDVTGEIRTFLADRVDACVAAGVGRDRILVDPGFGFGKTIAHNLQLLRDLSQFTSLGCPILVGVSRKRMIGDLTGRAADARMPGSIAAALLAVQRGARVIRAHDVAATVDALKVLSAVEEEFDGA
jgi:dihydropteroate synthase